MSNDYEPAIVTGNDIHLDKTPDEPIIRSPKALHWKQERDEAVAGLKFVANWSGGTDWPRHIIAGDILDCLNSKSKEAAK